MVVSLKLATSPLISPTSALIALSCAVSTLFATTSFNPSTSLVLAAGEDKLPVIIALWFSMVSVTLSPSSTFITVETGVKLSLPSILTETVPPSL